MPSRKQNTSFDREAAASIFAQILDELRSGADIERLNACRALFRSAVPFHLRSYAAAALILQALDSGASGSRKGGRDSRRDRAEQAPRRDEGRAKPVQGEKRQAAVRDTEKAPPARNGKGLGGAVRDEKRVQEAEERVESRIKEGRYLGEGVTIFLGMGRRQRFNARSVYRLLSERTELTEDQVGEIRGRDNYTFLVLAPEVVETTLASLDGVSVKGRRLAVNLARKREERPLDEDASLARDGEGSEPDHRSGEDPAPDGDAAYDMGAYGDDLDSDSSEAPESGDDDEEERL